MTVQYSAFTWPYMTVQLAAFTWLYMYIMHNTLEGYYIKLGMQKMCQSSSNHTPISVSPPEAGTQLPKTAGGWKIRGWRPGIDWGQTVGGNQQLKWAFLVLNCLVAEWPLVQASSCGAMS